MRRVRVQDAITGEILLPGCFMARWSWERMRGLLARPRCVAAEGVWFPRCWSVHTVGMRYAIDIVGLDDEGRVVVVREEVRPWRVVWLRVACDVIELAGGVARKSGFAPGRQLCIIQNGNDSDGT